MLVPMNVYAFSRLPFAFTYTLLFTGAFWAILLSRPLTGEHIPISKMVAVVSGFMGAIVVLRPWGGEFEWRMLIPLCSAFFFAVESMIARRFGKSETPLSLAIYPCVCCVMLMTALSIGATGFSFPIIQQAGIFVVGGIMMGIGFLCVPLAFRYGSAVVVGPFHYTQLIWAAILGAILFKETPDQWTLVGGAIIAISGLFVLLQSKNRRLQNNVLPLKRG